MDDAVVFLISWRLAWPERLLLFLSARLRRKSLEARCKTNLMPVARPNHRRRWPAPLA
jgi:hypothetical protein